MNFSRMRKDIMDLVEKGLTQGWSKSKFNSEIKKISSNYLDNKAFQEELYAAIKDEAAFINKFSMTKEGRNALADVFDSFKPYYANTKSGLREGINEIFIDAIKKGELTKTIKNRLELKIGRYRNYAETITRTAIRGFDVLATTLDEDELMEYEYTGPPAERPFCKHLLDSGKTYIKAEIDKMNNGQGLPVFSYGGGWNCRHRFTATGRIRKK